MTINTPEELVRAIDSLIMQMSKKQRKEFLGWVKSRRRTHDFNYPTGYKAPIQENTNEQNNVKDNGTVLDSSVSTPVVQRVQEPGIVGPDGTVISSQVGR